MKFKALLLGLCLALVPSLALAQTTQAQWKNADGSTSSAIVHICPDPNNQGKTIPCFLNGALGNSASVNSANELFVSQEPTQLFYDTFDSSLDTVNRWTATNGGTGLAPVYSTASATLNGGTNANSYSKLISQPAFPPSEPGWLVNAQRINIEFPVLLTGYRFWGVGTTPGSPTIAAPVTDGCGFDIGLTGKMSAVCYAAGTRNVIQDLSSSGNNKQPVDSAAHKYYIRARGDLTYWYIDDGTNVAVSSMLTGANGPNVNALPILDLVVSNSGAAETIVLNGVSESDTARNGVQFEDGTYPWRKALVRVDGAVLGASTPSIAAPTDRSGTLTTGGTSQTLAAANTSRHCLIVQNPVSAAGQNIGAAENLYVNDNAAASVVGNGANYAELAPGAIANFCLGGVVDQTAITVNATTISHRWYAKEY